MKNIKKVDYDSRFISTNSSGKKKETEISVEFNNRTFKIKFKYIIFLYVLLSLIVFGICIHRNNSRDGIGFYQNPAAAIAPTLFLGRPVTFVIMSFLNLIKFDHLAMQPFSSAFFIICTGISLAYFLKSIINSSKINDQTCSLPLLDFLIIFLANAIAFLNPFNLQMFQYPELGILHGVFIITVTLSVYYLTKESTLKNRVLSIIFLILSINNYQIATSIFLIYGLFLTFIEYQGQLNFESIKKSLFIIVTDGVLTVINLLMINAFIALGITHRDGRAPSFNIENLIYNIKKLIYYVPSVWGKALGLLPFNIMGIFCIILLLLTIYVFVKRKSVNSGLFFLIVVAASISIIYATHIVTEHIWLVPRTLLGIFVFLSMVVVTIVFLTKNVKLKKFLFVLVAVFFTIIVYQITDIQINHFATNKIDQEYIHNIQMAIDDYEAETGQQITQIGMVADVKLTYSYYSIEYSGYDVNNRMFITPWSQVSAINYYENQNYEQVPVPDEIYNYYFEGNDWNQFDVAEQLVFVGEILYIVNY